MTELVTTYEWVKSVHVLAAAVWVGGAAMVQLFALRAVGSGDPARLVAFAKDAEVIGMRTFIPASLVLVVTGLLGIHESGGAWSTGQTWVVLALIVFAASFVVGAAFLGPESGRIAQAVERHGADSQEVRDRIQRIFLVSRIELLFLALIVLDMVIKPGI